MRLRPLLAALLFSTLVLTIGDQFHVQFGVIRYVPPGPVFGQAWWVAPGFAAATIALVAFAWRFTHLPDSATAASLGRDIAWFFASYAITGVAGRYGLTLAVLMLAANALYVARRPRWVWGFSLLLGVLGTLGELALHATGVCAYNYRELWLVPIWLPCLYFSGAPAALSLARWCKERVAGYRL
ncbi:MAG: hypothetical protein U0271_25455 [Polyangiaceae bacterium]